MRRGRIFFGGLLVLGVLALSAPAAYAAGGGSAVNQGYPPATTPPATGGGNAGTGASGSNVGVAGAHKTVVGAVAPARAGGTLPFTGLQLGVVVLVGLALLGGGIVLRTSGRNRSST